jgi:small acid-soluble spore protein D (minor alpha/beta-type SASP)
MRKIPTLQTGQTAKYFLPFHISSLIAHTFLAKLLVRKEKSFSPGKRQSFPENKKERTNMSNNNNNQINVPQAREAMDRFKMQAASEVGVNLTNGYNGHLTSREAGSVGGQMVKKMIEAYEQGLQ